MSFTQESELTKNIVSGYANNRKSDHIAVIRSLMGSLLFIIDETSQLPIGQQKYNLQKPNSLYYKIGEIFGDSDLTKDRHPVTFEPLDTE